MDGSEHDTPTATNDPRGPVVPASPWETMPVPGSAAIPPSPAPSPAPAPTGGSRRWRRRAGRAGIAGVLTAGLAVGAGLAVHSSSVTAAAPSFQQSPVADGSGSQPAGWTPYGRGRFLPGGGSSSGAQAVTAATSAQATGVVDIDVVLGGTERAAGTGMVLTADGEVLTNRHVVEGETAISVTVAATGRTYAARVVGISTTTDVAVVQLVDASGLATVRTSSTAATTGESVTGVGNAGGTGGTPSAAAGTITGVDRSITASDSDGSAPEQLTGLLETDAAIQAGDSGGPLLASSNAVIGMDTAASAQGDDGYAIPIATALTVAHRIETGAAGTKAGAGTSSAAPRAYLGVEVEDGAGGAQVDGVVQGSPAAAAGLSAGDTITSIAGHQVTSASALTAIMASLAPGHSVSLTWTDPSGATHATRITPATRAG